MTRFAPCTRSLCQRDDAEVSGLEFGAEARAPVHVRCKSVPIVVVELNRECNFAAEGRLDTEFAERDAQLVDARALFARDAEFVDGRVFHQMPAALAAAVFFRTENGVLAA